MSLFLKDKRSSTSKQISINSQFLNTPILKKIASAQLACQISQLQLYHFGTDQKYGENQIVKNGDKIQYLIMSQSDNPDSVENRKKGILYPDELQKMIQSSKVIVIKSANEENIRKSKEHSVWATTFSNQERLKYLFNNSSSVILIFATNRSYEIKGIARMENEPDKLTDKSIWSGVANIRLGGNFKIKWLRKKPLSLVAVQKNIGTSFKETIIKACDGQQLDPQSCRKLAHLFETPQEPYYLIQDKIQLINSKDDDKNKNFKQFNPMHSNLLAPSFKPITQQIIPLIVGVSQRHSRCNFNFISEKSSSSKSSSSSSESQRKKKKIKKQKKKRNKKDKKEKKNRRKYSNTSQSSSQSSSRSSQPQKKRKKSKKQKKHKKHRKHRKGYS